MLQPQQDKPKSGFRNRIRKLLIERLHFDGVRGAIVGLIALGSALVTLWGPITDWIWPRERHIYVLHPYIDSETGLWRDFDQGLQSFLQENNAGLDTQSLNVGDYELRFLQRTWESREGLEEQVEMVLNDRKALAVVAATNSSESRILLSRLPFDTHPVVLFATATRNDLLRRIDSKGRAENIPGVYRMVPSNKKQAERLAETIVTAPPRRCREDPERRTAVVILREEADNSAFTRDLTQQLRASLEGGQDVSVLADASIDDLLTVPRELVELEPDYIVFVGSQRKGDTLYRQIKRIHERSDLDCIPQLLLTDAGIIGDGRTSFRALVDSSFSTLPLASEAAKFNQPPASFFTLGHDSGRLVVAASRHVIDRSSETLNPETLADSLNQITVHGSAQHYQFEDGENMLADFHLWKVDGGYWRHHVELCRSDSHPQPDPVINSAGTAGPVRAASNTGQANYGTWFGDVLRIGAKPFPEQFVLSNLAIESLKNAGIPARPGQESLNGIRATLLLDRIDGYWEYTGTALRRYFDEQNLRGQEALATLRSLDQGKAFWHEPANINNTFVLFTRHSFADEHDIRSISDLADFLRQDGQIRLCATPRWFELEDGLLGLQEHYQFSIARANQIAVPLVLLYDEFRKTCEVGVGFATDARLEESGLAILEDDQVFFPEYQPAFVLRQDVHDELKDKHPKRMAAFEKTLECLTTQLDERTMRGLNARVELGEQDPAVIAREYLDSVCPPAGLDVSSEV